LVHHREAEIAVVSQLERTRTPIGRESDNRVGERGYGVVRMAEQKEPVLRRVAHKIFKSDMNTREVVARLEAVRQALAMLDHPDIASVFDRGTTDTGPPF
jgi:hypothetical protein